MANKLLECVPNYSEGRDMDKIEKILVLENPRRLFLIQETKDEKVDKGS